MITNLTARSEYHQRMEKALVEFIARIQNGSQPLEVLPHVAKAHAVSDSGLLEAYDRECYDVQGLYAG